MIDNRYMGKVLGKVAALAAPRINLLCKQFHIVRAPDESLENFARACDLSAEREYADTPEGACREGRLDSVKTGWELPRQEFRTYCPRCCLEDLHRGEIPYGRLVWQQAWYTICRIHRMPLLLRRTTSIACWTRHQLQQDASLASALGYQHAKHPQRERYYIQYALLEIQAAIENALAGIRPRRRQWGVVSADNFLRVLEDVTTWSVTHFETVRSWSLAEDLTPIEIADGYKLLGRNRRMTTAGYSGDRAARSLVDIEDPAVRGSALWFAHSVMASFHQDASDRQTAYRRTSRQELKYGASPSAAREWLASRIGTWPERYRKYWLNPQF